MKKDFWIVLVIFIFGAVLRFYDLGNLPPGLNWDEVSHGYNAYSILKTGHDEWGQFLPLTNFRAYGDYPLPVYMYLSIPGILLLDLSEFSIRVPSAILGSLLILVVYLLARHLFKNKCLSALAALLVAVSPWGILTSRQVIQSTPALFFITLGTYLFIRGMVSSKYLTILGVISIGLSAYTYHNTRILAPLFLILLLYLYRGVLLQKKKFLFGIIIAAAIFFIPLIPVVLSSEGMARSTWVGILDQGSINRINEARTTSELADPLPRIVHNKITYFSYIAATNYLGYFSPWYLGFEGGTHYQFSIPHFGIVYPVELVFFYLGLIVLIFKFPKLSTEKKLLLGWIFLAPIPAAITRDPYQVVRSIVMLPAFYLITAFGFGLLIGKLKNARVKQSIMGVFVTLVLASLSSYIYNLWIEYPKQYSFAWQYGYRDVANYIKTNSDKYTKIVITKKYGEPHEFLLFYTKYDPRSYLTNANLVRYEKSSWYWVDGFDKYQFINDWEIKEQMKGKKDMLLITSPGNYPEYSKVIKTINYLDGNPAFDIVEL